MMACVALAGLNFLGAVLVHTSWVVATPPTVAVDGLSLWALVMAVRTELAHVGAESAAQVRASAEARELRIPRVSNAGPDQCPVCGGFGLADLAADDAFMERGPDRAKVVAWGRKRAHWDCAELSPYVPTAEEKARDTHFREHGQAAHVRTCDWCFTEDIRWEPAEARRAFERSQPELMESAAAGDRRIRLNRQPDPQFRHWLINEGAPTRHMDILTVESCEKAWDGHGWTAILAEPLRHELYAITSYGRNIETHGRRLTPLESERFWNREAGRPYTRTELGLCDCDEPVVGGTLHASVRVDWERLGEEFDREYGDLWPELKGWRR